MDTSKKTQKHLQYKNVEHKVSKGTRITRKVHIKGGRGHKSVCEYRGKKKIFSAKKPLTLEEMEMIHRGKFIRGLFDDCE
jgi:hypothetical protein